MNWYIVQAYSGFEKKVVETIKEELKKHKLSDNLEEILVPTHKVTEVKKGKRTKKEKKFFPGYVLIKIELTKQIFHLIKNFNFFGSNLYCNGACFLVIAIYIERIFLFAFNA